VNVCMSVCAASQLMSKASHVWLMRALYCALGEDGCTCVCVNACFVSVCVNVCVLVCAASQLMSKASHVWLMRALYCTLGEEGCTCVCECVVLCLCL